MFDLEKAIAAWRRSFEHRRVFSPDDLEELERHLRDTVAWRTARGMAPREAFEAALQEVGDYGTTETEYRKVYWRKVRHRHTLFSTLASEIAMLRNYVKIALRNLRKQKGFAFINVLGLAVGLAASLLILQYVVHELSYDDFHADADRIYRVRYDFFRDGEQVFKCATAFPRVGPTMKEQFPEVEDYARLYLRYGGGVVRIGDRSFDEENLFQADPSFLTMFEYPMLAGDRETALSEPNTAVISAEAAAKYFGDADPLGQRIRFGSDEEYTITGVAVSPENSHLKFHFLFSYATLIQKWGEYFDNAWGWYDFYTYLKLRPGADPAALAAKLPAYIDEQSEEEDAHERVRFVLQPLPAIHLHSDLIQEARVNGNATSVYFLGLIAFMILVIAWFNYVNLATARAVARAKEIGVRKVVGAHRGQLIGQFIFESLLLNVLAAGLALLLAWAALPLFNTLVGKDLALGLAVDARFWLALAGLFGVGALAAGLYPAFILSSYKPVLVLKGQFANARQGLRLRKVLVVGQFAASVALMAGTLIVYQQLAFMRSQDLGIDIDQVLVIEAPGVVASDSVYAETLPSFKQELLKHTGVKNVAASNEIPGNLIYSTRGARKVGDDPENNTIMYILRVDHDFFDTYGHTLLAGRGYSPEFTADSASVLLNERAVAVLGLDTPETALGERVRIGEDTLSVVGVVANHHQEGLQKAHNQIAFQLNETPRNYFSVKVSPADLPATLAYIEQQYAAFFPENPFTHFFLDGFFDRQYRADRQFGQAFGFFAILAILVACLGLFGLSSFTATQRTKEIGIRKALGGTVTNIALLLSKDFLRLVLVASVLAVPLVWIGMDRWLDTFAFRIGVSAWIFVAATALTLLIALATVSYQAIRAALADPVEALRYE